MTHDFSQTLVSTDWLARQIGRKDLHIMDTSWYMPASQRNASEEFAKLSLPGAHFFDIDKTCDRSSNLPHMLPSEDVFAQAIQGFGVNNGDQVVVYDSSGLFSAARLWWMFHCFGHQNVAVLDGGLPKWIAENRATATDAAQRIATKQMGNFKARLDLSLIRSATQVAQASADQSSIIIDARAAERFQGNMPEPREGLRSGHIPNSLNLPFAKVLQANGQMKSPNELKEIFKEAGVNTNASIITSCGSGITAAILSLALKVIGTDSALYDGSWSEWGMNKNLDIATGEA